MTYPFQARDMRHLLAVARKLRAVADAPVTGDADRELFLTAAAALEARAAWMATSLPGDHYDAAMAMHRHQPINLLV